MTVIELFDLGKGLFCDECGHPKSHRLFDRRTGCSTCDAVRTAHRCTGSPLAFEQAEGDEWTCPACGATYRVEVEVEEIRHHRWAQVGAPVREVPPRGAPASGACHWAGAIRVHVKPGCRCKETPRWRW